MKWLENKENGLKTTILATRLVLLLGWYSSCISENIHLFNFPYFHVIAHLITDFIITFFILAHFFNVFLFLKYWKDNFLKPIPVWSYPVLWLMQALWWSFHVVSMQVSFMLVTCWFCWFGLLVRNLHDKSLEPARNLHGTCISQSTW